jgi:hypothetical protein
VLPPTTLRHAAPLQHCLSPQATRPCTADSKEQAVRRHYPLQQILLRSIRTRGPNHRSGKARFRTARNCSLASASLRAAAWIFTHPPTVSFTAESPTAGIAVKWGVVGASSPQLRAGLNVTPRLGAPAMASALGFPTAPCWPPARRRAGDRRGATWGPTPGLACARKKSLPSNANTTPALWLKSEPRTFALRATGPSGAADNRRLPTLAND